MEDTAPVDYSRLAAQLTALIENEPDALANAANFVALLYAEIPTINWLGIYVLRGDELVLGPFQGAPACVRIPLGRGVCGTAAADLRTLRVADVDSFAGHIACDSASRSEIVVPLIVDGNLLGVVDVDSPVLDRFSAADEQGIENVCRVLSAALTGCGKL